MKNVLIVGLGRSGIGCAELLKTHHIAFSFYDGKVDAVPPPAFRDASLYHDDMTDEQLGGFDTLVLSPGVPVDIDLVCRAKTMGIEVIGEVELAWRFTDHPIIGITGTNGKTTTTALVGEIFRTMLPTAVVGNIGSAMTEAVAEDERQALYVAELSSFQLETTREFHPQVAAILNITPDHLNRHKTMAAYIAAKFHIFAAMNSRDKLILNYEDDTVWQASKMTAATVVPFSAKRPVDGAYAADDILYYKGEPVIAVKALPIIGPHNIENVLAAIAVTASYGLPLEKIAAGIRRFKAVPHRLEFVTRINGTAYYNDSKGTNPDAAICAVNAIQSPTILIAGGYDKQSDYLPWLQVAVKTVKLLLLMGETAPAIAEAADVAGIRNVRIVRDMAEAVDRAFDAACAGDVVLLSPACASWGMYRDYEERGEDFKERVRTLAERNG